MGRFLLNGEVIPKFIKETLVLLEVVLEGGEAKFSTRFDVGGEVIDVIGLFRDELIHFNRSKVEVIVWFDLTNLMREDGTVEEIEVLVGIETIGSVNTICIRKEDEAMALAFQLGYEFPDRLNGCENTGPSIFERLLVA